MMKKKEEKKAIPSKNYIILFIIIIITFLLVYYFYRWYQVYADYQNDIPVIRDTLTEITKEEMEHYIEENPTNTIYLCTASRQECRSFEATFKKLIEKKSLNSYIVYVNLTDQNLDEFVEEFNRKYPYKISLTTNIPALVTFVDGEVSDILEVENNEKLSLDRVSKYLKVNKIGE